MIVMEADSSKHLPHLQYCILRIFKEQSGAAMCAGISSFVPLLF